MAASNTKFRVENGLFVEGSANVTGSLRVDGDLTIVGNLIASGTVPGNVSPNGNGYFLGNTDNRWSVFAMDIDGVGNLQISNTATLNVVTVATSIVPTANNKALGNTTSRWDLFANNANVLTIGVTSNATLANATVSNTLIVGNSTVKATINTTHVSLVGQQFAVNTGVKTAIGTSGNSTNTILTLDNDTTSINGNVFFDTDLMFFDATNNRVGLKNTSPSSAALLTITGNAEFSTINTAVRFMTSNATHNAHVTLSGNTTNSRMTFSTYTTANSTTSGGFVFNGVTNSTTTTTLLEFNYSTFQYKTGNVAHAGNFGIYNVSGTRLGP